MLVHEQHQIVNNFTRSTVVVYSASLTQHDMDYLWKHVNGFRYIGK